MKFTQSQLCGLGRGTPHPFGGRCLPLFFCKGLNHCLLLIQCWPPSESQGNMWQHFRLKQPELLLSFCAWLSALSSTENMGTKKKKKKRRASWWLSHPLSRNGLETGAVGLPWWDSAGLAIPKGLLTHTGGGLGSELAWVTWITNP